MPNDFNKLYLFDEYVLNPKDKILYLVNDRVQLPAKAFETLKLFVERSGEVISKEEMIDIIWEGTFVEENNLSQKISILRRIFGKDKKFIETIPKIGFRFVEPVRIERNGFTANSNVERSLAPLQNNFSTPPETDIAAKIDKQNTERIRSSFYLAPLILLLTLVLGTAAYFVFGAYGKGPQSKKPSASFDYTELTDTGDVDSSAVSNDGKFIAFTKLTRHLGVEKTSLRLMDTVSKNAVEIKINGNIQPGFVTFAPDGESIYFRTLGNSNQYEKIYQISKFGGEAKLIAEDIWGKFSISPDGKKLTYVHREIAGDRRKIIIQNIESGEKEVILDSLERPNLKPHHVPSFSPDQKFLAFSPLERVDGNATIVVIDISSKQTRSILTPLYSIKSVIWTPTGDGFYIDALELGKRFQLWNISYPGGELERVTSDADSYHDLSVSKDGIIVSNRVDMNSNVWIVPEAKWENAKQLTHGEAELGGLLTTQFIPNGDILYNARFKTGSNIRLMSSNGENGRVFVDKQLRTDHNFSFSKSRELIFFEFEDRIWRAKFDGSGAKEVKLGDALKISSPTVSYDDKWLYFVKREKDKDAIWRISLDGGNTELVYTAENFTPETFLTASPDGKYLAFEYENREKIYVNGATSSRSRNFGFLNLLTRKIRIIEVPAHNSVLRWTNGGRSFDFPALTQEGSAIYRKDIENDSEPTKVFELEGELIFRFDWSADGKDLLIGRGNVKMDLVTLRARPDNL